MFKIDKSNGHTIITLEKVPELACTEQGKQLRNIFTDLTENSSANSIVVNLKEVVFLNSSIIGTLINGQKMAQTNNIKFSLVHVHPDLSNMFELASIKDLFTFYKTLADLPK